MKALYESEFATIYCGDAREYAESAERASVDLLVTDPPYGIKYRSNWSQKFDEMQGDDNRASVLELLGDTTRALRDKRHAYIFGYIANDLREPLKLSATVELVWNKTELGLGDLSLPWASSHECVTFGAHYKGRQDRLDGRGGLSARLRRGSILKVSRKHGRAASHHPTEKPVELMRQLIESSSCIGELVLDPFAGSGSTLVAAIISGRRCVGVEIDEKYARIAVQRVKAAERVYGQIAGL